MTESKSTMHNGVTIWKADGQIHNENGPAFEWADGTHYWFLFSCEYTFEAWCEKAGWSDEQVVMYKLEHG